MLHCKPTLFRSFSVLAQLRRRSAPAAVLAKTMVLTAVTGAYSGISMPALAQSAEQGELLAEQQAAEAAHTVPVNGWVYGKAGQRYTQAVHYPASTVNLADGQNAAISGRIAQRIARSISGQSKPGSTAPYQLIVNGVTMPLAVDESGRYARPYHFGSGSNSLQINSPDGKPLRRVQFYDSNTQRAAVKLRVLLNWDTNGTDLDLHIVTPSGQHAYYGNRVIQGGGALDVDVTTGYGPEIFSHPAPEKGEYLVFVNYYGGAAAQDMAADITTATISVITSENTASEKHQTFTIPMRKPGELLLVSRFVM